jgi:hypothetical protein
MTNPYCSITWLVIRRAVLMEDEGREHVEGRYDSHQAAQAWVNAQKGYFRPGDFYVASVADESPRPAP